MTHRPTAAEIFRIRASARALLVEACELPLAEAVDELQLEAERGGLVQELGQDAVQKIIAAEFEVLA